MNARRIILLLALLVVSLVLIGGQFVMLARGQSCDNDIIVDRADATNCVTVAGSNDLNALISDVEQRFVVWRANAIHYVSVGPFSGDLLALMGQVEDRIVIRHANANRLNILAYPKGLTNDTTPPQISELVVENIGADSVNVSWLTDEFASTVFQYGLQSGGYTHSMTDPLVLKRHEITLVGLTVDTIYYYRITHTDRSDNAFQSQEYSFTIQPPVEPYYVHIPFIRR